MTDNEQFMIECITTELTEYVMRDYHIGMKEALDMVYNSETLFKAARHIIKVLYWFMTYSRRNKLLTEKRNKTMANKKDLKSSMAAGMTGGLDSLIQPTAPVQEPEQPKKEKAVHCNFVINQSIHTRLKTLAIRKGITLKEAIQEAALEYLNKYE